MSRVPKLRGTYYGEPSIDLTTPEGRRDMHAVISELLVSAEAGGAPERMLQRLRDDLALLTED